MRPLTDPPHGFEALAAPDDVDWERGPDAHWRALTEAGNAALKRGDLPEAMRLYGETLAEAERLFARAAAGEAAPILFAPMTYTIACQNAAEVRKKADDRAGAFALRRRAVERLVAQAEFDGLPLALRVNCVRHLRHALAFLAEEAGPDTPDKAGVSALMERAGEVSRQVFALAREAAEAMQDAGLFGASQPEAARSLN